MSEQGLPIDPESAPEGFRAGFVALVGRPNVGKSTLLNRILGEKLAITSRRPQTTRHRLLGIHTTEAAQYVFVDTPGIHQGKRALNRYMTRAATSVLDEVDAAVFVVEAPWWNEGDQAILERLQESGRPVVVAVNKVDRVNPRDKLLPYLAELDQRHDFAALVPLSAAKDDNVEPLLDELRALLPESPPLFPEDQITDKSLRFLCAELVREQVFHQLGEEVPYAVEVVVDQFTETDERVEIAATILVERETQKGIVLGKGGRRIKAIGTAARKAISAFLEQRVHLELYVRVRADWSGNERALRDLGYDADFS